MEIGHLIVRIRSDRGKEFDNVDVDFLCELKGIKHEFSALKTPQQNVGERKNRLLQEMVKVMILMHDTPM